MVEPGVYEHFKGGRYAVLGAGKHSETGDFFVVYQPLYPSDVKLWVRPLEMFTSTVLIEGKEVPRFRKVEE
jgi:hypothetical protein